MMGKKALVTGAAGFIGSSLVDRLLEIGWDVWGVDNFSTGLREFLRPATSHPRFRLVEVDLLDLSGLRQAVTEPFDVVFHLAANADIKEGLKHPRRDLDQNIVVTSNLLELMRQTGARRIVFSSTGSVYGEAPVIPTPENCPFPVQTSLYGASKLAAEAMISAYSEGYGIEACVFRFVSILGERYTHGHVFDFVKKLKNDPSRLPVLGNGRQKKSYLYVGDCVRALTTVPFRGGHARFEVFNLGTDEYTEVNDSIGLITARMGVSPSLEYSGGDRGWVGDNPFIWLDCAKVRAAGWRPERSIRESVLTTVDYLLSNPTVLDSRE